MRTWGIALLIAASALACSGEPSPATRSPTSSGGAASEVPDATGSPPPSAVVVVGDSLPGTLWTLTYVDGRSWPVGNAPEVTLSFDTERLGGFNGCNEFGARWRTLDTRLDVRGVSSTLILCHGPSAWVENRVHRILSASPTVSLGDGELRLTAIPEGVLTFEVGTVPR